MSRPFIVIGDAMVDVIARVDHAIAPSSDTPARIDLHPGGSAANTAAWLAELGHPVQFVGAVGDDAFGSFVAERLQAMGIDCALSIARGVSTGTCVVIVDQAAQRTMLPDTGANTTLTLAGIPDVRAGCHLHLSGYTLLNPQTRAVGILALGQARAAGLSTSLDPSSAAPLASDPVALDDAWSVTDILLANADEARVLTGEDDPARALDVLAERVPTAVVKLGAEGAIARSGSRTARVAAARGQVVDTTGAGDAFAAGFLPAWVAGADLAEALDTGTRVAARAVARVGAWPR